MKSNYLQETHEKKNKNTFSTLLIIVLVSFMLNWQNAMSQCLTVSSSLKQDFNERKINSGDYIWFSARLYVDLQKVGNVFPLTITVANVVITDQTNGGVLNNISVPGGQITIVSNTGAAASTSYDAGSNQWTTTVPAPSKNGPTEYFLTGLAFLVPSAPIPPNHQHVYMSANFFSSVPNVSVQWQWSAAVYQSVSGNNFMSNGYNGLGVKAADNGTSYNNSDEPGSPENQKAYLTRGATGNGVKFVGDNGPKANVIPGQCCLDVTVSSSNGTYFCQTASTTLTATSNQANTSFYWTANGSTGNTIMPAAGQGGTFTVIGTSSNGCQGTADISLQVDPTITVSTAGSESVTAGGTITLHATVGGGYSFDPMCLTWTGPNGFTANVMGGVGAAPGDVSIYNATSAQAGVYTVTAVDCYGSACSATANLNVSIASPKLTQFSTLSPLTVYPNPTHDKLSVQFLGENNSAYQLKMIDMTGRIIINQTEEGQQGINFVDFDLSNYAKGIYVLSLSSNEKNEQVRIVVE